MHDQPPTKQQALVSAAAKHLYFKALDNPHRVGTRREQESIWRQGGTI